MHDQATAQQIAAATSYEMLHVPALFRQWAPVVLDAADVISGDRILDIACGTGVLAREARTRVGPDGSVVGVDADPGMLAVAGRIEPAVEWRLATAEQLPFDDSCFDAVLSQFGLMFFADRPRSVREMLRVAKPGDRVAVAVWDSLERTEAYPLEIEILERRAGRRAADALRAPFALGDPAELAELFEGAGATAVEVSTRTGRARFPSVRAMVEADLRGWLPVMGVELAEPLIADILTEADEVLAPYVTDSGEIVFDAPAHLVVASTGTR